MNNKFVHKLHLFVLYISVLVFPVNYAICIQPADSAKVDSVSSRRPGVVADTTIHYYGSPVEFVLDSQKVILHGPPDKPAKVEYRDMTLTAARITILLDSSLLKAEGVVDTTDSIKSAVPRLVGTPVFQQKGQDPLYGEKIEYNLKNQKGRVIIGRTKHEDGFYSGDNITRVGDRILEIKNGTFSTCPDEKHPHFYFRGGEMKVTLDDKVVARPVVLYIADVPVFYLPFGVFPIRRGRHSGLIIPTFGSSQLEGRYLRGLGYYYAPNDFMDVKGLIDFYEKTGFMFRGDTRYAKRYSVGGNISGSFTRKDFISGQKDRLWDLEARHRQEINASTRLTVDASFASGGSFYRSLSLQRDWRATRELISNATLHKSWPGTKNNLTLNLQRRQDLQLGNLTTTLPQINFSRTSPSYPFRKGKKGSETSGEESGLEGPWYANLSFRYNSSLVDRITKQRSGAGLPFARQEQRGVQHNANFLLPFTALKYIHVSPSLDVQEEWYDNTQIQRLSAAKQIIPGEEKAFAARHLFDTQISATTKIYGIFAPKIGDLTALRHIMTPTVSLSYRPDFSTSRFNYFKTIYDTAGIAHRYDRFNLSPYGGTPQGRVGSLNMNLSNILQMKNGVPDKEKKRDIFNMDFSSGYNFAADHFPLSDLLTSFRMLSFFDLDMAAAHSFYQTDPRSGQLLDKFRNGIPRLTRFQATTSFKMQGGEQGKKELVNEYKTPGMSSSDEYVETVKTDREERFIKEDEAPKFSIPYEIRIGARFNIEQYNPRLPHKIFSTTSELNFNLTQHWKISHNAELDFVNRKLIYQDFSFYRDLHCWEFRFNWTPTGALKGYYLNIRIKAPQLHDLKIEERNYGGSVLGPR